MFIRVVRFTDASADNVAAVTSVMQQAEGPPEGVPSTGVKLLFDEQQATAVVLQFYATAEDMAEGDRVMSAMDFPATPGTRASVDRCEIQVERSLGD